MIKGSLHIFFQAQDEGGSTDEEEEDSDEDEEEGEEESDHESLCHVCGEDGELICCDQCPKVYHLDCHEPPIRRLPRLVSYCQKYSFGSATHCCCKSFQNC